MGVTIYNKDNNSFINSSFTATYLDTVYAFDVLKDDVPYVLTASRYTFSASNRHLMIYLFIPTITNTNGNITIMYSNDLIINVTMDNITNFNYIRIINRSFGYWIGLAEGKMQTIFIYLNNDTQYNRLENDVIIPNPSLNYAIVNGEIKSFSIDINNETYRYSDLIKPIKLYESNELAMGKWIGDDVVAIFKNESDSTDIYKIDFDTNTKILLYSGTIIDLGGIKLQAAFNTDNAFVLNENTLGYNAFVKNQIGDSELTKLTKDGRDYVYQPTTSATANDIRRGVTAYSNGERLIGSMIDNGSLNYTPSTETQTIPMGYTAGGTVAGDANLLPENIKSGVEIFGVVGTYTGENSTEV